MGERADELAHLAERGLCVEITGQPMSGRTALAMTVADRLAEFDRQVLAVTGIRALRDRPLGALSVLPPAGGVAGGGTLTETTRALAARLGEHGALVVDDVEDLDSLSTGVLHAVRIQTGVPVVVTRRAGTDRALAVTTFVAALRPSVRVELGPMPFAQVHHLLHEQMPGPIDPATVASIAMMAGGLPSLVVSLVTAARADGRLVQRDGLWQASEDMWSPAIGHTMAPFLRDLEQDDVDALTLLAVAGAQAVPGVRRLLAPGRLDHLEQLGLVTVTEEAANEVLAVVPPALGEYLAITCGAIKRRALEERIASELAASSLVSTWGAAGGDLQDSIIAKRLADHWEGERRVLLQQWEAAPTAENATPLLVATLVVGGEPTPEQILRGTDDSGSDGQLHAWYALSLAIHAHDISAARAHLEAAAAREPGAQGLLGAAAAYVDLLFDHVPEDLAAGGDGLAGQLWTALRIERDLVAGDVLDATAALDGFDPTCPLLVHHRDVSAALALILAGDVDGGTHAAVRGMLAARRRMDPGLIQAHAYVATLGLALSGRFVELDALVASALTVTTNTPLEEHYRGGVLALASMVSAWQGHPDFGRRLALQARALDHRVGALPGLVPGPVLAAARAEAAGDASADALWGVADERLAHGYVFAGMFAGLAAVERAAGPGRGARLAGVTAGSQSTLLTAMGRYAQAAGSRDVSGLHDAHRQLLALGARTFAVRALVVAAVALREAGQPAQALADIKQAWTLASTFGGQPTGLFAPFVDALGLSAREFEILEMIAAGLTTNQIAQQLTVSPRTVENHVFSAYRKSGIDNRDDVRTAMSTWLLAPA